MPIWTLIPLSAAKVGSYLTYFQSKVVNLTYFQSKVIYFQSKVIGSENTAACSPSVSICNRAVGSWTKSSDLVQKIPLLFLLSLPSREYDNVGRIWQLLWWSYDDRKLMTMKIFLWGCCWDHELFFVPSRPIDHLKKQRQNWIPPYPLSDKTKT